MAVGLIARMTAHEGERDLLARVLAPQLGLVADEPATLLYTFNVSDDAPSTLWSVEVYQDPAAVQAHGHVEGVYAGIVGLGVEHHTTITELVEGKNGLQSPGVSSMAPASTCEQVRGQLTRASAHPGQREALLDELAPYFETVADQSDTLLYLLQRAKAEPDDLWLYAIYRDAAALAAHVADQALVDAHEHADCFLSSTKTWDLRVLGAKGIPL